MTFVISCSSLCVFKTNFWGVYTCKKTLHVCRYHRWLWFEKIGKFAKQLDACACTSLYTQALDNLAAQFQYKISYYYRYYWWRYLLFSCLCKHHFGHQAQNISLWLSFNTQNHFWIINSCNKMCLNFVFLLLVKWLLIATAANGNGAAYF